MKTVLGFINSEMERAGIEYHLLENRKPEVTYPYFVGELIPADPAAEDGMQEFTLILDGFNRKSSRTEGTILELLEEAEKIEEHFPPVEGRTAALGNQAVAVFYCGCQMGETGDEQLQKVQINLTVKTWKGGK